MSERVLEMTQFEGNNKGKSMYYYYKEISRLDF